MISIIRMSGHSAPVYPQNHRKAFAGFCLQVFRQARHNRWNARPQCKYVIENQT